MSFPTSAMQAGVPLDKSLDALSGAAQRIVRMGSPQVYQVLVPESEGSADARAALERLTPRQVIALPMRSEDDARCVISGLWLWHDFLDQSHRISQGIATASGSFWHAIMHRREGDFPNSKHWYARCADHPVMQTMGAQAAALLNPLPADKALLKLHTGHWKADAFVDLVEQVHRTPEDPRHGVAVVLQLIEWQLLLQHCARAAAGA